MNSRIFESYNEDRGRSGATDLCINLYPEKIQGEKGPVIGLLLSSPGLTAPVAVVGAGPVRGEFTSNDGNLYVVSGNGFYKVTPTYVVTLLGNVASNTGPVSIIENPTQLLVVDGIGGWCYNKATTVFTQVIPNAATSDTWPNVAVYQDGFGLVNSLNSNQIYQSNYNDLSTFATLVGGGGSTANNAFVHGNPKNVLTMFDLKEEVWILKKDAVEVWINQGAPGFAFAQLQGVYLPVGIVSPASVARLGDSLVWLGSSDQGRGTVFMTVGYAEKVISSPALTATFQGYAVISDAIAYTYTSAAHNFYVLTFPTQGVTWVFDLSTGKWTQRGYFSNSAFGRELANCHALFNGIHIVGDYRNGNLYSLDDNTYTDNTAPRKWVRSWRALPPNVPQGVPMSFDSLEIILETGITVLPGTNPQMDLRFSDDSGYTWNGPFQVPLGQVGQTTWRAIQNRLGSTTLTRGLDRIWEISSNDPVSIKIVGANFEGGAA